MRFTMSLEEDLYRVAKSLSKAEDSSVSAALNKLIRSGLDTVKPEMRSLKSGKKLSTFPVSEGCRPFSEEEVYAVDLDEEVSRWTGF